ncbi:DUF1173 domain-containing protein (plasmid) [Maricurvus nonylphenolicus]|uniref:DUF1173 domain-containing protein n=1 Tax=Maricurvus nonylphenolicus TaxID=1008307 RepID=UPI0036F34CAF
MYKIGENTVSRDDFDFTQQLMSAYKGKVKPLCMCLPTGVPMYIAHVGDTYIIKRMPNSGGDHHPDCESYEIPSELSGRGDLDNKAIQEDHSTGITKLKLDFALTKNNTTRAAPQGESSEKNTVKSDPAKLSLRSLLHYLYEDAGLNKWYPRMEGKRNWFVVRKYLLEAIANKVAKNSPLSDTVLIPENFNLDKKDEHGHRIKKHMMSMRPQGNKQPVGVLIGAVKEIEEARFGYKLKVKHLPEAPFYMGKDVYRRIYKNFPVELSLFEQNESTHLLTICTFFLSASGNPQIDSISFMLTDSNWLPVESIDDMELTERATSGKRSFIKGLRYNLASTDVIASMLLTDIEGKPTAVYISPIEPSDEFKEKLDIVLSESDLESFIWDLESEEMLQLPK